MPSLILSRNNQILHRIKTSNDPYTAGLQIRCFFESLRGLTQITDVMDVEGEAEFGHLRTLLIPSLIYNGHDARWLTGCHIDATSAGEGDNEVVTKDSSTPGFTLGEYSEFNDFYFGGECWNTQEDGGLIGWATSFDDPAELILNNCEVDASKGMDWGIYTWQNVSREITMNGGIGRFCRILIAAAASGGGADQTVTLNGVQLLGNANGSVSVGATSANDSNEPLKYGVLVPVLNRLGDTSIQNCKSRVIGLSSEYASSYGCPRIVALVTNHYSDEAGSSSSTVIDKCFTEIIPGTAIETSDIDIRGDENHSYLVRYNEDAVEIARQSRNSRAITQARGLSGTMGFAKVIRSEYEE